MKNKLISVIIPVYNTSCFLDECLYSVSNQTYKYLEIIVINDGSTDSSLEIIKKHAKDDHRIKIIDKKNEGGGIARNAGLDIITGDYVAFVDSDDRLNTNMYEIMMKYLKENNADMAICDYSTKDEPINLKDVNVEYFDNHSLMKELFIDEKITSHFWRKLYPAKVFENNRFSTKKVVHDMSLDHLLLKEINKAVYINIPLYIYREDNPNNLSNTNAKGIASSLNRAKVMIERYEFAKKYYPDLADIVFPKMVEFLMSSYIKLKRTNNTDDQDFVVTTLKKYTNTIYNSKIISLSYKVVVYSIINNIKPLIFVAELFYKNTYGSYIN